MGGPVEPRPVWLEGGVQNKWSVSKMRKARWEALGAPEELKPKEEDIITRNVERDIDWYGYTHTNGKESKLESTTEMF